MIYDEDEKIEKLKTDIKQELSELFPGITFDSLTKVDVEKFIYINSKAIQLGISLETMDKATEELVSIQNKLTELKSYMDENDLDKVYI